MCGRNRRPHTLPAHAATRSDRGAGASFRKLYDVERKRKDDALSPEEQKARGDEHARPVLVELHRWIEQLHPTLVPGTPPHAATTYTKNRWAYFERGFEHGRFEIDDGEAERQIRPRRLDERNDLFAGSENGAVDIAAARTIITYERTGVDPLAYLTDTIAKVQSSRPKSRLEELLPDRWRGS